MLTYAEIAALIYNYKDGSDPALLAQIASLGNARNNYKIGANFINRMIQVALDRSITDFNSLMTAPPMMQIKDHCPPLYQYVVGHQREFQEVLTRLFAAGSDRDLVASANAALNQLLYRNFIDHQFEAIRQDYAKKLDLNNIY